MRQRTRCSLGYRQFLADNNLMFIHQCYRKKNGNPAATTWPESAERPSACRKVFEKNVVKTFSVLSLKTTIYTANCETWANPL
jgi:hypothetical protein